MSHVSHAELIGRLHEVLDALARRTPRNERDEESGIAADSSMIKERALARLAELQFRPL
jgi:hypothetical protein